jgi:hypothetical protein
MAKGNHVAVLQNGAASVTGIDPATVDPRPVQAVCVFDDRAIHPAMAVPFQDRVLAAYKSLGKR